MDMTDIESLNGTTAPLVSIVVHIYNRQDLLPMPGCLCEIYLRNDEKYFLSTKISVGNKLAEPK